MKGEHLPACRPIGRWNASSDTVQLARLPAADAGCEFTLVREGGKHTVYRYGSQQFTVPRHKEINELTARAILRSLGIR